MNLETLQQSDILLLRMAWPLMTVEIIKQQSNQDCRG
jgi:hypothetical protein